MVVTGNRLNASKSAIVMAKTRPKFLYAAVGIHPHFVKDDFSDRAMDALKEIISSPEVVCVGEIGLDFNRDFSPREDQKKAFEKQVWQSFPFISFHSEYISYVSIDFYTYFTYSEVLSTVCGCQDTAFRTASKFEHGLKRRHKLLAYLKKTFVEIFTILYREYCLFSLNPFELNVLFFKL